MKDLLFNLFVTEPFLNIWSDENIQNNSQESVLYILITIIIGIVLLITKIIWEN